MSAVENVWKSNPLKGLGCHEASSRLFEHDPAARDKKLRQHSPTLTPAGSTENCKAQHASLARKHFSHQTRKSRFHFHIFFRFCHSWSLTLLKMYIHKHTHCRFFFFLKVPLTFINVHIIIIITIKNIIWQIANCCRHNQQQLSSPASIPWENKT